MIDNKIIISETDTVSTLKLQNFNSLKNLKNINSLSLEKMIKNDFLKEEYLNTFKVNINTDSGESHTVIYISLTKKNISIDIRASVFDHKDQFIPLINIKNIFDFLKEYEKDIIFSKIHYDDSEKVKEDIEIIGKLIEKHKIKSEKKYYINSIGISSNGGYYLLKNKIKEFKMNNEKLNLHYGKNFNKKYDKLVKNLKESHDGLTLLHGRPGTGKTTLIKHLITKIDKPFIYLPGYMVSNLSSPQFITYLSNLSQRTGSFVLIEEAEEILKKREDGTNPYISNILNISNGILNDIIKAQIIWTFNTNLDNIDDAIVRAGRLKFEHKFDKLTVEETNDLMSHLEKGKSKKELTVSEIYNKKVKIKVSRKIPKMGFH